MPWRIVLVGLLVAGPAVPGPGPPGTATPAVVGLYPDPVAHDDRGEFVAVRVPPGTDLSRLRLSDGEGSARPLPVTASGRVLLSTDPEAVRALTDRRVVGLRGRLRLANDGDEVRLHREGRVVDATRYRETREGERLVRGPDGWEWRPLGLADRPPVRVPAAGATVFVLPDRPAAPLAAIEAADERVLLAGYTLTSRRVGRALRDAADRGATVRVLVDGGPVGGLTRREAAVLDELTAAGVRVTVLAGGRARFAFHHAKYAVADDRAVVLTENWKPAGTGGHSSRGWGVVVDSPELAAHLAALFRSDAGWRDGVPWREFRAGRSFEPSRPANDTYPSRFRPRSVPVDSVRVLTAPDNAEPALRSLLATAEESVLVEQVSVGGRRQPLVRSLLAAARRGVRVRLLLSRAWYVREENWALVDWLNERARREGLPLAARLARPRSRFEKVHAKGVVVDGERVAVGSLNWNNHSTRENREVVVVLESEAAARYFGRVFRADWRGGAWRLPVGLALVVAVGALVAGGVARRILAEWDVAAVVPTDGTRSGAPRVGPTAGAGRHLSTGTVQPRPMDELVAHARDAREQARAPYSGYDVGAAVRTTDGDVYRGCNVEVVNLSNTLHAEEVAIGAAAAAGYGPGDFAAVAVSSDTGVTPCGMCRQTLREFAGGSLPVLVDDGESVAEYDLGELLPASMGPEELLDGA